MADILKMSAFCRLLVESRENAAAFRKAHLPGAIWCPRPLLDRLALDEGIGLVVVSADNEDLADLAAFDLRESVGDEISLLEINVLAGGNSAWMAAGLASEASPDRPADGDRIDFLFWAHDRHQGNLRSVDTYLDWESKLPDRVRSDAERLHQCKAVAMQKGRAACRPDGIRVRP